MEFNSGFKVLKQTDLIHKKKGAKTRYTEVGGLSQKAVRMRSESRNQPRSIRIP